MAAIRCAAWPLLSVVAWCGLGAQASAEYARREERVAMRDGVRLTTVVLTPRAATIPLPILLIRTPFGAARECRGPTAPPSLRELAEDGYIFVCQDIRGRGASEGTFVTLRPPRDRNDPRATDESTDAWDTIDWLVKTLPGANGKVGMLGVSYRGWLAALAAVDAHPALKAISPQAPVGDAWMGDDFFHQGAFRQNQAVVYAAYIEGTGDLTIPEHDQFEYYLRHRTLAELGRAAGIDTLPSWVGFRAHPAYDAWWQARSLTRVLPRSTVPMLVVGGWWDQEDMLGAQALYGAIARGDGAGRHTLVMGPWAHGSWARPGGDSLGPIGFGRATADDFRTRFQRPWFAWYLHGRGDGRFPAAWAFEGGSNTWRTFDAWPPRAAVSRALYLREGGRLAFEAPTASGAGGDGDHAAAFDAFRSDPAHPVPYLPRPDDGEGWDTWMQQDQRFVDNRPDVLTWSTPPLTEDLVIAGEVSATLFASTTGSDADWVVKLIDVFPDSVPAKAKLGGHELIVNADIMRGRYWKDFARATPIPSNTVTPFRVALHGQAYRFGKGHRVMVQVQSTWFPLYDRNPQVFVPNIFLAKASDFRAQVHRVWHTARYPSRVELPVLP